jgi:hypothetical protein
MVFLGQTYASWWEEKTSETNTKDFLGKKNDPKSSHYEG